MTNRRRRERRKQKDLDQRYRPSRRLFSIPMLEIRHRSNFCLILYKIPIFQNVLHVTVGLVCNSVLSCAYYPYQTFTITPVTVSYRIWSCVHTKQFCGRGHRQTVNVLALSKHGDDKQAGGTPHQVGHTVRRWRVTVCSTWRIVHHSRLLRHLSSCVCVESIATWSWPSADDISLLKKRLNVEPSTSIGT